MDPSLVISVIFEISIVQFVMIVIFVIFVIFIAVSVSFGASHCHGQDDRAQIMIFMIIFVVLNTINAIFLISSALIAH